MYPVLIQQICPTVLLCGTICLSSSWTYPWWLCWFCCYVWLYWYQPWRFLQVQSPLSMIFTLLYLPFPQSSIVKLSLISLPFSLPPWMESHYCPLLYCLHPPPAQMSVKLWSFMKAWWTSPVLPLYLVTLSSCNLHNIIIWVHHFWFSEGYIYLPWVALYLIVKASIKPNLHNLLLDWTIWWIHLWLVWHCRKPIDILSVSSIVCHGWFW